VPAYSKDCKPQASLKRYQLVSAVAAGDGLYFYLRVSERRTERGPRELGTYLTGAAGGLATGLESKGYGEK